MYNNNSSGRSDSNFRNSTSFGRSSNFGNSNGGSRASGGNSSGSYSNYDDRRNDGDNRGSERGERNYGNGGNDRGYSSGYSNNSGNLRGYSSGGGRSFGGNGGGSRSFGGGSRFGGNRKFRTIKSADLHISKYIKKSKPVQPLPSYQSINKFADFPFCRALHDNIAAKGYVNPTPIQDQSILPLLEGKDLVGIASTGTGKTAAFLLPIIDKIYNNRGKYKALIIVPTRELATQIEGEFYGFARGLGIYSVLTIGGTSVGKQIANLRRRFDVVIGTPGRIKDMTNRGLLNMNDFQAVVLDEVDRMLDMGFINDIREVMAALPKPHQTLFFSATMDKEIAPLMNEFLVDPVTISVKTSETNDNIEQDVVRFGHHSEKFDLLQDILKKPECEKVLIFGQTKFGVEELCQELVAKGFKAISIHGDKKQNHRSAAIRIFAQGNANILVATDVAARGLDIDDITHVINYETPDNFETYTHRIGRTGRGNKNGTALTFYKV